MAGKFEVYADKGGKFRFRLKASNGQIILVSQAYKTKTSALEGVASVQRNAQVEARFERKASGEQFMFNLKATNGQVIGTSERYKTERANPFKVSIHPLSNLAVDTWGCLEF
jgi:hypothetical protein